MTVLDGILKLLHPVMPFVTEELWHKLPGRNDFIMKTPWPKPGDYPIDEVAAVDFTFLQEATTAIRTSRSELNIPPSAHVTVVVVGDKTFQTKIEKSQVLIKILNRIENLNIEPKRLSGPVAFAAITGGEIYILLEGMVDLKAEAVKLQKDRQKQEKYIQSIQAKLSNDQFTKNAPAELVEAEKEKLQEATDKVSRIDLNLKFLEN
jgi:valyl-tRNA synthetase